MEVLEGLDEREEVCGDGLANVDARCSRGVGRDFLFDWGCGRGWGCVGVAGVLRLVVLVVERLVVDVLVRLVEVERVVLLLRWQQWSTGEIVWMLLLLLLMRMRKGVVKRTVEGALECGIHGAVDGAVEVSGDIVVVGVCSGVRWVRGR